MTIPYPEKYMKPELGVGKLADYQDVQADSLVVGAEGLGFGVGVQVKENVATAYKDGKFYGVSYAKNYVEEIPYGDVEKIGKYKEHEMVPILRKGSIWVKVNEDVLAGEDAKVLNGGNFGKATTSDTVIGTFKTTASSGNLAILQINLP
ncbi:hypothetical protein KJZ24_01360 [Enterococcus faecalis]|uniref:structural cement protein Gp24 n=1 Tax=Enterococcus faecalis TaxID=1351 RepID=UPI0003541DFE|nr:hypothetical protein [Enterococcus faecalis]EGO5846001.1 hypothetical protein [Enterococcus faecalis]EGO7824158.1 hypothetical protein [Enterococcus faecalis]EGO9358879.1 hypothetical protein [Enterococcus faecalis]EPH81658.1 hypothetical protein D924_02560 [Enterococcus faecalis 06-MB-S-10]EPH87028.1 hypothetical protein D923_02488 [Enterococcus faecalis 06-MB-S-04]